MHDCVETIFVEDGHDRITTELWGSACDCDRTEDHDYGDEEYPRN